jgi:Asp-tRNA(Asn)/Glu-tRNA(Gln) amidotransferase A subunit family amidase
MNVFREIYKKVDVIVTPTTGIVAPEIPPGALSHGLSDYTNSSQAMKFICILFFIKLLEISLVSLLSPAL